MKKIYSSSTTNIRDINAQKLEKIKIFFLFSSALLLSATVGILVARDISTELYAGSLFRISTHFETAFLKCSKFVDCAKIVALYSLSDVVSLLRIFAAAFSILNYLITDMVLLYNGMKLGVTVAFLVNFNDKNDSPYHVGNIRLFVFILFELMILSLFLYYAYLAATSTDTLRRTESNGRPNIKTKDFFQFATKTAACVGAVFIINSLYCLSLYILK